MDSQQPTAKSQQPFVECPTREAAIAACREGRQAVFVLDRPAPAVGRRAPVREQVRPRMQALLYDRDAKRLERTARELGCRFVCVKGYGNCQHVLLSGWQAANALARCRASRRDAENAEGKSEVRRKEA